MTVGRREGQPNITVIYDGEIIGGMTSGNGTCKEITAEPPGRVQAELAPLRDRRFVQVIRRRLRRHAEYLARSGQAARLLHATRGQRQTSLTLNIGGDALARPAATGRLVSKHPQIGHTR